MKISIVVPVYNEAKSLPELFNEIRAILQKEKIDYEIIAINDGSRDNSWDVLKKLGSDDKRIKALNFKWNNGQTAAMSAGIRASTGDVVIPIDSDLENDPADIPKLLKKMEEGFTVVSGWRKERWSGSAFSRKIPSVMANWLISKITGVKLHDYGCTLKAYDRDIISEVELYGEMHRFIPAYAKWKGGRVAEIPVNYRPRKYGESNYGISRTFRVLLDLVLIKFLVKYMNRPMHFFGGLGFFSVILGLLSGTLALVLKYSYGISFISTPMPVLTTFFIIVGIQMAAMGILAEMIMRTYYESQSKTPYSIKEKINFD
ncbi:MAG: Dolichol-phosphate mannosyltransferase [Parcubacteria group bacterium GW2011_GWF2_38_76]|nr:MAG: Dolichol-phosphate mannosyltransferase [Parcubacteria group bacterium GW2011_GWF2_38_76]HBM45769.1 glycosyltransferase [Patescibacteria group bacterium]